VPVIRTVHSIFDASGRWWLSRRLQGMVADRFVQEFVACSADVAGNEERFARNPRIIMNWVDDRYHHAETRTPDSESGLDPLAVIVGNCSDIKNHELALAVLLDAGFRIAHLGDESRASSAEATLLDEAAQTHRLATRGVGDPLPWLRRADLFAFPSRYEGMGVALAEAVAMGVPSLVNDVPGLAWARHAPGVQFAASPEGWRTAVANHNAKNVSRIDIALPDLRAERGAREYTDVYSRALSAARRS
jgi:glycosyltransferase involved in cell wall biosynthesis